MADQRGRVLLADPRGYCAGVDRAVVAVERTLEIHGAPVYVRKQIVHNKHVVATLERRGAVFVDETDEVPEGSVVVFSAHGVSPAVHEEARERNLRTIDATCPLVSKVHSEAKRFAREDYDILLIGHRGHEEVEGTSGEAPDRIQLVDSADDVASVQVRDPERVVWLSQTTLSVDETLSTVVSVSSTESVVCESQTTFSGSRTWTSAMSSGPSTSWIRSGASPEVPSTSSCPLWPISRMS